MSKNKFLKCLLALALVALTNQPAAYSAPNNIVRNITLDLKLHSLTEDQVNSILPVRVGDNYQEGDMAVFIKKLKDTNLFVNVAGEVKDRGRSVVLHFDLEEAILIRKVKITGNYPYLASKILRLSSLQTGDPFRAELLDEGKRRIQKYFEQRGYYGSEASIHARQDPKKPFMNLHIRIKKGSSHHLGKINVTGNQFYPAAAIKNRLYGFTRFRMMRVKKIIKKIQKNYVKHGFVRAHVKLEDFVLNPQTNRFDLDIQINERKRFILKFEGNNWFQSHTLDDYVTFYRENGYDRLSVERSLVKLQDFYRLNGFRHTTIVPELQKYADKIMVIFTIHEGPRTRLKKIIAKGMKKVGKGDLLKIFQSNEHSLTRLGLFREDLITADIARIVPFYESLGFFDAQVKNWNLAFNKFGDQATLTILIDEGFPYRIKSLAYQGNLNHLHQDLLAQTELKTGKIFEQKRLAKARGRLLDYYLAKGYPHATVIIEHTLDPASKTVDVVMNITEGPRVTVGRILVSGKYNTKERVILDALKVRPGDLYRYKEILQGQLNLKRIGIFDHVRIIPEGLEEKRADVDLIVNVVERKNLTLDIQAGYDSDKLASGQLLLTKRNIFGSGKQIQLRGVGGFEMNRGEITFYAPRVWGASWNLINQYFVQHEDDENFNAFSYGGSLGTLKNFGPDWTLLLKGQLSRFNIFEDQSNQAALRDNLFDSTFLELSTSAAFDTRNNYADPSRGLYVLATTEFDTDVANISNNFNISKLNISHYLSFLKKFTLTNTIRMGKLSRISDAANIPAQKLFFMGGNDTVRGFDEDAINASGGTTSAIYNAELSYQLTGSFELAGFFDAGSLTDSLGAINRDTIRDAAGVGLRYITPVGPIRLDYGFVLDKKVGEKGQRFHFSFGYFF